MEPLMARFPVTNYSLQVFPIEDFILIPPEYQQLDHLSDCFFVRFEYTHYLQPIHTTDFRLPVITFMHTFMVACDVISLCHQQHNVSFLLDIFRTVPIPSGVLESVLERVVACGVDILSCNNDEGPQLTSHIDVNLQALSAPAFEEQENDEEESDGDFEEEEEEEEESDGDFEEEESDGDFEEESDGDFEEEENDGDFEEEEEEEEEGDGDLEEEGSDGDHLALEPVPVLDTSLRTVSVDPDCAEEICSICIETFGESSAKVIKTRCSHLFHEHCILPWLNRNSSCPYCRQVP